MDSTEALLCNRQRTHGHYPETARVSQEIKNLVSQALRTSTPNEAEFVVLETLDLIATKLARIACGDMLASEHWEDIAGYTHLVLIALEKYGGLKEDPSSPHASPTL